MGSFNATATNHRGKIASLNEPSDIGVYCSIFRELLVDFGVDFDVFFHLISSVPELKGVQ